MSEWKECKLEDLAKIQTGPFGSQLHASDYVTVGIPNIMPTNIGQRLDIRTDQIVYVDPKDIERLKKYKVVENDIVYSRRGDVEKCAFITEQQDGWLCGTGCLRIRFSSPQVLPKFVAYYLSTPDIKSWVLNSAVGTTMPNLNSGILTKLPLRIPEKKIQKQILNTLSSLDDKIDLLHRQNKILEAMAETLFRQWFVEEAEESWEVGRLGNVLSVKGGTTPSTAIAEYWDGDVNWTTPKDLSNHQGVYMFSTERKITKSGLTKIGSGLLPVGTVLLSSRAPIGYLAINEIPVAINQGYIAIICDKGLSNYFIYSWCKANIEEIKNSGNGSVFQEISKTTFKELPITIPAVQKMEEFDVAIEPVFQKIKSNQVQIEALTQMRDSLLPKLMSGDLQLN